MVNVPVSHPPSPCLSASVPGMGDPLPHPLACLPQQRRLGQAAVVRRACRPQQGGDPRALRGVLPRRPRHPGWRRPPEHPQLHEVGLGRRQSTVKVPPRAAPQLGSCASSGRAWQLWAARHSQEEADSLGAQPPPRVLERAASKAADSTTIPPHHHPTSPPSHPSTIPSLQA